MGDEQNKLIRFWQELKRRKVVKVIILYATTAYILLQVVSLVVEPLRLPHWVMTLVIVLLIIGFPFAVIFSWIFDLTPEGIEITVPSHKEKLKKSVQSKRNKFTITNVIIGILLIAVVTLAYPKVFKSKVSSKINPELEKSIAVLPFANDSNDSTNVYIINGLMESILNNLSKIKDLKVISRTSVEKYRNNSIAKNPKLMSEIANELNANYIVEGSGQKYGDKVFLHIQLLEAKTDKHLLSNQFERSSEDIIDLQIEVAKKIAGEIEAVITPEEEERIERLPTTNKKAFDYFLKGDDILTQVLTHWEPDSTTRMNKLKMAQDYFNKAIDLDTHFALAYARMSTTYSYLNGVFSPSEYNSEQSNKYADRAILEDSELADSWSTKGYYYYYTADRADYFIDTDNVGLAIQYLEKSLRFNPNNIVVIRDLAYIYSYRTDTEKYLEYALKVVNLDINGQGNIENNQDSIVTRFDVVNLSRSLRWAGFFDEAEEYFNKAMDFEQTYDESMIEKAELICDSKSNYLKAKKLLESVYQKDGDQTGDRSLTKFIAQMCYFLRDWRNAYKYYSLMPEYNLLEWDYGKFGAVCKALGKNEEADQKFKHFEEYLNTEQSFHKYHLLAELQSYRGETTLALENLRTFSQQDNIPYWAIRFIKDDPMFDNIRKLPKYKEILKKTETKFWDNHKHIEKSLKEKELL